MERPCHGHDKIILWHIYSRAADELIDLDLPLLFRLQISQGGLHGLGPWCVASSVTPPRCDWAQPNPRCLHKISPCPHSCLELGTTRGQQGEMERQGVNTGADFYSPQTKGYFLSTPSGELGTGDRLVNPYHITVQTGLLITQQY